MDGKNGQIRPFGDRDSNPSVCEFIQARSLPRVAQFTTMRYPKLIR